MDRDIPNWECHPTPSILASIEKGRIDINVLYLLMHFFCSMKTEPSEPSSKTKREQAQLAPITCLIGKFFWNPLSIPILPLPAPFRLLKYTRWVKNSPTAPITYPKISPDVPNSEHNGSLSLSFLTLEHPVRELCRPSFI